MDETSEWCNNFVLVPNANGKVLLCVVPVRFNKALVTCVHRGPTLNDILLGLAGVRYLTLINVCSSYQNLIILNNIFCPFFRYSNIRLPFRVASVDDIFQKKIDKIFSSILNVFSIADGILIAGFDDQGKDMMKHQTRYSGYSGRKTWSSIKISVFSGVPAFNFGKIISKKGVSLDPRKMQVLTGM